MGAWAERVTFLDSRNIFSAGKTVARTGKRHPFGGAGGLDLPPMVGGPNLTAALTVQISEGGGLVRATSSRMWCETADSCPNHSEKRAIYARMGRALFCVGTYQNEVA